MKEYCQHATYEYETIPSMENDSLAGYRSNQLLILCNNLAVYRVLWGSGYQKFACEEHLDLLVKAGRAVYGEPIDMPQAEKERLDSFVIQKLNGANVQ